MLEKKFKVIKLLVMNFPLSDHKVLNSVIGIHQKQKLSKSYWKFNVLLCEDDEFVQEFIFNYKMWQTLNQVFLQF